ncbi:2344_t:CDS:2 [Entrophospora sp. SA101]|nr:2344_t:CDS:2 [Entrophospora sp. SA101]
MSTIIELLKCCQSDALDILETVLNNDRGDDKEIRKFEGREGDNEDGSSTGLEGKGALKKFYILIISH